jgi:hypothetical protein
VHPSPPGSFSWRVSCYEEFGWTPDECKDVLRNYPMEADLLSIYFEELSAFRGEQHAEMLRKQGQSAGDPSWHTDMVLEDEDDE